MLCIQSMHQDRLFCKSSLRLQSLYTVLILKHAKSLKTLHLGIKFEILWLCIFQVQGILQARNNQSTIPLCSRNSEAQHFCIGGSVLSD